MMKVVRITRLVVFLCLVSSMAGAHLLKCGGRQAMVEQLKDEYKEKKKGFGFETSKSLIELWTSKKFGTFTILRTDTSGMSCILTVGRFWRNIDTSPWRVAP